MTVSLSDEFRLSNFGFDFNKPHLFAVSQWHSLPDGVFVAWRLFWALWNVAWMTVSIVVHIVEIADGDLRQGAKWLIFLTNWSFLLLTLQSIVHLLVVIKERCAHGGRPKYCPDGEVTFIHTVIVHAVNTFYVITDMFMSGSPMRILHFVYGIIFGLLYILFTYIYFRADGTNDKGKAFIYSALDWDDPGPTAILAFGNIFIGASLIFFILFSLYTLRLYIHQSCCGAVELDDETGSGNRRKRGHV